MSGEVREISYVRRWGPWSPCWREFISFNPRIMCAVFVFCHRYKVDRQNIAHYLLFVHQTFYIFAWGWLKISHFMAPTEYSSSCLFICLFVVVVVFFSLMAYLNLNWTWKKCPILSFRRFQYIDPPEERMILEALKQLYFFGALDRWVVGDRVCKLFSGWNGAIFFPLYKCVWWLA